MKNPFRSISVDSSNGRKRVTRERVLSLAIESLEGRSLFASSWVTIANSIPGGGGTAQLLSDGTVMVQTGGSNRTWALLTPNASGSYQNGTWTRLASMHDTRLYTATQVLRDGRVFIAGGEYGTGGYTGEVYDPKTNTWTNLPAQSLGYISDAEAMMMPDGRVLIGPVSPSVSGFTTIYDPVSNTWLQGPKIPHGGTTNEDTWVILPDGTFISIDGHTTSARYIPSTTGGIGSWANDGAVPVDLIDNLGEIGGATMLADGRAIFFGATTHTAYYTPSGSPSVAGTWAAGPDMPFGLGQDDAPVALLPSGKVLIAVGPSGVYSGPTSFYIFDPTTNTYTATTPPGSFTGPPYVSRMLNLPDGGIMVMNSGSTGYIFYENEPPVALAVPTITSLTPNANGTVTLVGTGLNGIAEGSSYGDDSQQDTNRPIVKLVNGANVYYARTHNWDSNGVQTGATPHTTNFTLPLGIPAATYSVYLIANGVSSTASSLTVSMTAGNTAPTVGTVAAASPSPSTLTTTNLSVLGADVEGEANLTYTWTCTSAPASTSLPSYSINGTNAAKNTVVTFPKIGTYTFKVFITDAGGLSTTSTVSVTVNATRTSIAITPAKATNTTGATRTFTATTYDQFGATMTNLAMTWSVLSGAGSISASGVYTAPATGTLATIQVTDGTRTATAQEGVVNSPWASSDIGTPTAGQAYSNGAAFNVTGGGADIWGTADDFRFVYRTLTGDGTITARVASQTNTGGWAKAGVMFRNSLVDTDMYALELVSPSNGTAYQYRATSAGSAAQSAQTTGRVAPYWVRMVRVGNTFTAYASSNGTTWVQQGTAQTIAMGTTAYVGLAVDANNASTLSSVVFDNVAVNATPNIATASAATPSPVTGTQTALSVLGADQDGESTLTYTWSSISGPANVAFTSNGTNAAKSCSAMFIKAGSYTLRCVVTDGSVSLTSDVVVTVNPTLTTLVLSPASPTVGSGQTQQFTAVAYDQFGEVMATPAITWSLGSGSSGSIDANGLYTGGGGAASIIATSGSVIGNASVLGGLSGPTIVNAAAASQTTVTGNSVNLSALGSDDAGEASLTYTWSLVSGAAPAGFTSNGANASKNTTASFTAAGAYVFKVTITDAAGLSVSSNVNVTVVQTAMSLSISPTSVNLGTGLTKQFTAVARDQFGATITGPGLTWAVVSGGGTVNSSGLFTAPANAGKSTVRVTAGALSASAALSIFSWSPYNLVASKTGPNNVKVTYRDSTSIETGFQIQVGQRQADGSTLWLTTYTAPVVAGAGGTGTYNFASAFGVGTWYFRVRAQNGSGVSNWSNTASVQVTSSPVVPNLVGPGDVTIGTGQGVQFGTTVIGADANWEVAHGAGTISNGYFQAGNTPGTSIIEAEVNGMEGGATVTVIAWSPTNLVAKKSSASTATISFKDGGNLESGFEIQAGQKTANGTIIFRTIKLLPTSSGTGATVSTALSGLKAGEWYIRTRATSATGNSNWSNTANVIM